MPVAFGAEMSRWFNRAATVAAHWTTRRNDAGGVGTERTHLRAASGNPCDQRIFSVCALHHQHHHVTFSIIAQAHLCDAVFGFEWFFERHITNQEIITRCKARVLFGKLFQHPIERISQRTHLLFLSNQRKPPPPFAHLKVKHPLARLADCARRNPLDIMKLKCKLSHTTLLTLLRCGGGIRRCGSRRRRCFRLRQQMLKAANFIEGKQAWAHRLKGDRRERCRIDHKALE